MKFLTTGHKLKRDTILHKSGVFKKNIGSTMIKFSRFLWSAVKRVAIFLMVFIFILLAVKTMFGTGSRYQINRVKKEFRLNNDDLQIVREYVKGLDSDYSIFYDSDDGPIVRIISSFQKYSVADVNCFVAMKNLKSAGYRICDGNYLYLQIQRERDLSVGDEGIIFFFDDNQLLELAENEYITELYPITEDGWYYYVAQYESSKNGKYPVIHE